jgi:hypothetical protein
MTAAWASISVDRPRNTNAKFDFRSGGQERELTLDSQPTPVNGTTELSFTYKSGQPSAGLPLNRAAGREKTPWRDRAADLDCSIER